MTRFKYGGGGEACVIDPTTGLPRVGAPAAVYNAFTGGTNVTDIQNLAGTGLAGTVTTDAYGQAVFLGPDGYTATLYLDFGVGPRWGLSPKELDQPNAGGKIIADQRTLDYSGRTVTGKSNLPYNSTDPLLAALAATLDPLGIPRFPSQATRNAAFGSPTDGDTVYRTDLHCRQVYNGAISRWVSEQALIGESVLANSTTNSVTFSSIPQEWNNLRIAIDGRCAASSQTHKWGVETYAQFNADSTAANYNFSGYSSMDKVVSGTTTYGISTVDASGGSTTTPYSPPWLSKTAFAGDLGARLGFMPGESSPSAMWGTVESVITNYSWATGRQVAHSRSQALGFLTTNYMLNSQFSSSWIGNFPITSLSIALFTGAFFAAGSTIRLYGF